MLPRLRYDHNTKTATIDVPEGWVVTVKHDDQNKGILNVVGVTSNECMVRTPTGVFPKRPKGVA